MAIKIEMLRSFSVVAQTGSLAEAAARLGRTPSAISMTLKQLEEHLGQRLFESDRKNRLTSLGDYVLEQAQNELRQFDSTIRAIETFASTSKGLIRIATVPSVAGLIFPTAIEQFTAAHPGVSVELRDMDSASVLNALSRGQVEIGIATSTGTLRNFHQQNLFSDAFGLVCAKTHPLAQQPTAPSFAELKGYQVVRNELCARIKEPSFQALLSNTRISAHNTLSLIAMVRSQHWVTVLPSSVVHIDPDQVMFRNIRGLSEKRQVDLFFRDTGLTRTFVGDFAEILVNTNWQRRCEEILGRNA